MITPLIYSKCGGNEHELALLTECNGWLDDDRKLWKDLIEC